MNKVEGTISLDTQLDFYQPGETVQGKIEYEFKRPTKVRGIHVTFTRESQTEFSKRTRQNIAGKYRIKYVTYSGNEDYFHTSYCIFESDDEAEIPAGVYVYNFSCELPADIPSSFEGEHGYVRYTVNVTLDMPRKINQETIVAFTVVNTLDLNLDPLNRTPIHFQMQKTFWCLCCISQPVSVEVQVPVSGYCPGQTIPFTVNVENSSNVEVPWVQIDLVRVEKYIGKDPSLETEIETTVVASVEEGPAPARSTTNWTLTMEVPPLTPSHLENCGIIDLDYELEVTCVSSIMHFDESNSKHITIGTVPLE